MSVGLAAADQGERNVDCGNFGRYGTGTLQVQSGARSSGLASCPSSTTLSTVQRLEQRGRDSDALPIPGLALGFVTSPATLSGLQEKRAHLARERLCQEEQHRLAASLLVERQEKDDLQQERDAEALEHAATRAKLQSAEEAVAELQEQLQLQTASFQQLVTSVIKQQQVRKQQADRLSRVHRYAASLQAEKGELQLQAARAQQALANSAQHAQQGGAGLIKAHHSSSEKSGAVIDAQEGKQSISKDGTKSAFAAEAEPASSHSQTDTATVSSSTPEANKGISSSDSSRTAATAQAEPGTSILPLPAAAVAAPSPPSIQSNVKKTSPSTVSSEVSLVGQEQAKALAPAGPADESSSQECGVVKEVVSDAKGRAAPSANPAPPNPQVCVTKDEQATLLTPPETQASSVEDGGVVEEMASAAKDKATLAAPPADSSSKMCMAKEKQARALAPASPMDTESPSVQDADLARQVEGGAQGRAASAARPAPPSPHGQASIVSGAVPSKAAADTSVKKNRSFSISAVCSSEQGTSPASSMPSIQDPAAAQTQVRMVSSAIQSLGQATTPDVQQGGFAAVGCFLDEAFEVAPFTAKSATYRWLKDPQARLLGRGASAAVYWAERLDSAGNKSRVVIKHIMSPYHVRHAKRESLLLKAISGRWYSVPYYSLARTADEAHAWIVTGEAPGKDLESICQSINAKARAMQPGPELNSFKAWAWRFTLQVFFKLVKALEDIHLTHSHRDFKLANIMVSGWDCEGEVQIKTIDWGSGRAHEEQSLNECTTLLSASPQLLRHMGQGDTMVHMEDTSNDMWALGCAFFMLATCTSPGWEPAFKPQEAVTMRHIKALPPQQQRGACAAAILKEQHRLVEGVMACQHASAGGKSMNIPWQVQILQYTVLSATQGNAAEAVQAINVLLHMLQMDTPHRVSAAELAQNAWLASAAASPLHA